MNGERRLGRASRIGDDCGHLDLGALAQGVLVQRDALHHQLGDGRSQSDPGEVMIAIIFGALSHGVTLGIGRHREFIARGVVSSHPEADAVAAARGDDPVAGEIDLADPFDAVFHHLHGEGCAACGNRARIIAHHPVDPLRTLAEGGTAVIVIEQNALLPTDEADRDGGQVSRGRDVDHIDRREAMVDPRWGVVDLELQGGRDGVAGHVLAPAGHISHTGEEGTGLRALQGRCSGQRHLDAEAAILG